MTATNTATKTATRTPTSTWTPVVTNTPTNTKTPTFTPQATQTPIPTATITATATVTPVPTYPGVSLQYWQVMALRAVTGTILTSGQLPATMTAIYTAPASSHTNINFLSIYQSGANAPQTIKIWITPSGGSDIPLGQWILSGIGYSAYPIASTINLGPGDAIKAATTDAVNVDYVISGANTN